MSALAFIGEVQGYASNGCCSPCGNRRQVVHTLNGLHGDVIVTIDGYTAVIEGNTIHFVGGAVGGGNDISGTQSIFSGVSEVAVVFAVPFDAPPIITGANVIKADPADKNITVWGDIQNLTANGFTAVLSGTTPNANYVLHWEAAEEGTESASVTAYYGKSTLLGGDMDTAAEIIAALANVAAVTTNDNTLAYPSSAPTPKYLYYAFPASLGLLTSAIVDGLIGFNAITDFDAPSIVDFSGVNYYLYRSTNALQGAFTVQFS